VNKRQINQLPIIKETCRKHVFGLSSVHLASLVVSELHLRRVKWLGVELSVVFTLELVEIQ
jgi:hypothetical protein